MSNLNRLPVHLEIIEFLLPCRYAANIERVDYEGEKVLIHYRQWSHRYDEWFEWTSPYLRPVERVQLRRQGLNDDAGEPVSMSTLLAPALTLTLY